MLPEREQPELPTRQSCRGYTTPDEKGQNGGMRQQRDRAQIVHRSQSTRLIRVCAGTTHCCADEKAIRVSSTQKRIFVHP